MIFPHRMKPYFHLAHLSIFNWGKSSLLQKRIRVTNADSFVIINLMKYLTLHYLSREVWVARFLVHKTFFVPSFEKATRHGKVSGQQNTIYIDYVLTTHTCTNIRVLHDLPNVLYHRSQSGDNQIPKKYLDRNIGIEVNRKPNLHEIWSTTFGKGTQWSIVQRGRSNSLSQKTDHFYRRRKRQGLEVPHFWWNS